MTIFSSVVALGRMVTQSIILGDCAGLQLRIKQVLQRSKQNSTNHCRDRVRGSAGAARPGLDKDNTYQMARVRLHWQPRWTRDVNALSRYAQSSRTVCALAFKTSPLVTKLGQYRQSKLGTGKLKAGSMLRQATLMERGVIYMDQTSEDGRGHVLCAVPLRLCWNWR